MAGLSPGSALSFSFTTVPHRFLEVAPPPTRITPGDVVVFGAGYGTPYPAMSELGYPLQSASATAPLTIRLGATQSFANIDHYDFDLGGPLLADGRRQLHDAGDVGVSDGATNPAVIAAATRALLGQGAVPILLRGGAITSLIPVGGHLVIQIDLDAMGPSVAGAVNAPTPGGFGSGELAALLRHVVAARGLARLSPVEIEPGRDANGP